MASCLRHGFLCAHVRCVHTEKVLSKFSLKSFECLNLQDSTSRLLRTSAPRALSPLKSGAELNIATILQLVVVWHRTKVGHDSVMRIFY